MRLRIVVPPRDPCTGAGLHCWLLVHHGLRWLGDVQRACVGVGFFGGCGGPGSEEFEGVVGGRCGFGGVDEDPLAVVGG